MSIGLEGTIIHTDLKTVPSYPSSLHTLKVQWKGEKGRRWSNFTSVPSLDRYRYFSFYCENSLSPHFFFSSPDPDFLTCLLLVGWTDLTSKDLTMYYLLVQDGRHSVPYQPRDNSVASDTGRVYHGSRNERGRKVEETRNLLPKEGRERR